MERKEVQRLINTESGSYEIHQGVPATFGRSTNGAPSSFNGTNGKVTNGHGLKATNGHGTSASPFATPKRGGQAAKARRRDKRQDGPVEVISQNGSFPPRHYQSTTESLEESSASNGSEKLGVFSEEIRLDGSSQRALKKRRLKIPLEKFDDPALEVLTPTIQDWLKEHGGSTGVKAKSKYFDNDGTFCWASCTVTGYDPETSLFTIIWDRSGIKKKVRRFNLVFNDEDFAHFKKRIRLAQRLESELGSRTRIQRSSNSRTKKTIVGGAEVFDS